MTKRIFVIAETNCVLPRIILFIKQAMHRETAQQYDCSITSNLHLAIAFQKPDNDWRSSITRSTTHRNVTPRWRSTRWPSSHQSSTQINWITAAREIQYPLPASSFDILYVKCINEHTLSLVLSIYNEGVRLSPYIYAYLLYSDDDDHHQE